MKKAIKKLVFVLPAALLFGCEPEFDDISFNGGSADFSNTVAVGNSLTAGYQSSALRRIRQEVSFPSIVAQQLKQVGGGEFKQPLMNPGVGLGLGEDENGNPVISAELGLKSSTNCLGETSLAPSPIAPLGQASELNPSNFVGADGPFNNVGIPGAKSYEIRFPGYAARNPFYGRFVDPMNPSETAVEAAMRNNPTFFMLWIGNNDVLLYATNGGDGVDQTGNLDPSTYGREDITDPNVFANSFSQTVTDLTANGAKGVVANIPDVTSIPYFNVVPIGTDAVDASTAALLNGAYAAYNTALDGAVQIAAQKPWIDFSQEEADSRKISFTGGQLNTFVVIDPALTDLTDTAYTSVDSAFAGVMQMRQARPGELMTLTTPGDSLLCAGWGTAKAIPNKFHLSAGEISAVKAATDAYNSTIRNVANANGLAFVDMASILNKLGNGGVTVDGITFTSDFITGGAFSMDGVHLSDRGYAFTANEFIKAINATYGANVPQVSIGDYSNPEVVN